MLIPNGLHSIPSSLKSAADSIPILQQPERALYRRVPSKEPQLLTSTAAIVSF